MKKEKTAAKEAAKRLLAWYDRSARQLPWRESRDPYRIWISEIMLQQTRVEAVREAYLRFLERFPDVFALAGAQEEQVLKLWEGLGYYSRARNLQKAARVVVERYHGVFPRSAAELARLPGIGSYTAGAISSIAFDCREPAVDGNVLRVMMRLAACRKDVSRAAVKAEVTEWVRAMIPERAGAFNQALMELGAVVCLPNGAPLCDSCPLVALCEGRKQGIAGDLPAKARKKERICEEKTVFVLLGGERAAFRQRPRTGLLAGTWELPNVTGRLDEKQAAQQIKAWGYQAVSLSQIGPAKHIFTHREWHMTGWLARVVRTPGSLSKAEETPFFWADSIALERELTVPSAFCAFLEILRQEWDRKEPL